MEEDYEQTDMDKFVEVSGNVFAWMFISEFALKALAMGFLLHKKSYLRHTWWNVFDFIIVIISIMEVSRL